MSYQRSYQKAYRPSIEAVRRQREINLEQVYQVYLDLESQDRLGELVDTGLSVDEARAVVAEEKTKEKANKFTTKQVLPSMNTNIRSKRQLSSPDISLQKRMDSKSTPPSPAQQSILEQYKNATEIPVAGSSGTQGKPLPLSQDARQSPEHQVPPEKVKAKRLQREGVYEVKNDGAFRQEIEIDVLTKNGLPITGSVLLKEAKYNIYRYCLGFENFNNLEGVRFGFRGTPIVIFKLKVAINLDEMKRFESFEFERKGTRDGKEFVDVIGCKIRGIRSKPTTN